MEEAVQMIFQRLGYLPALFFAVLALPVEAAEFREMNRVTPPPLVLKDAGGKSHNLAAYKGKVVLVNFWATWCPPCREEMPSMQRLKEKMTGRPFVMLGVDSGESPADLADFLDKVKVDFTVVFDPDGAATRRWKVFALPTSFLLDQQGKVRYVLAGPAEWDGKEAVDLIEGLLKQPASAQ
jgi:thiol-disulfide isomerase/thioredoxin